MPITVVRPIHPHHPSEEGFLAQAGTAETGRMAQRGTLSRREADLVRRCYAGLPPGDFINEMIRSLHALMPLDAVFFATADPATLLFTSAVAEEPLVAAAEQFMDNEFGAADVNKFQSLAVARPKVATLDAATSGNRSDSPRYRDIMAPIGLGDELRVALVSASGCWGYLCLHRADSPHGFTAAEARVIARIATHIGNGCRDAVTALAGRGTDGRAPGVLVLHPDLTLAALTGEAEYWLGQLLDRPVPGRLPVAVLAAVARLRSIDAGHPADAPSIRVPSAAGWLLVHASHLTHAGGDIAVVIEAASATSVAPLVLTTWALTARERDIAMLVLRGASTHDIAAKLCLSPYTIKDHMKSIFDKSGVRSRRDLVARVLASR
jgi:DNA-binding CsgD family transcriptional regulator